MNDILTPGGTTILGGAIQGNHVTFQQLNITQNIVLFNTEGISNSFNRKNELQIIAIRNLYKTQKLLQLDIQFANSMITENEYENEININIDKYSIDMVPMKDNTDILIINEIVVQACIDKDITVDEVSEMFSVENSDLLNSSLSLDGSL